MSIFKNRQDAGQQLAETLIDYQGKENVVILALPRGGVPVAFELAKRLSLPMTVFLVRKIGVPGHEELAMGAVAEGGICLLNQELISRLHILTSGVTAVLEKEKQELSRRLQHYRQGKQLPNLTNKIVILVDDGIATGATCKVAIQALNTLKPKQLMVATPLASKDSFQEISTLVDKMVCLATPEPFYGVGQWYEYFDQTSDEEVLTALSESTVKLDTRE